jgi:hypothetical protein
VCKRISVLVAASFFIAAGSAAGEPFDGSKTLICAWIHTVECNTEGECGDEVTKIQNQRRENGQLILQGVEAGRAWSLLISESSGDTVLTVSDVKAGFVAFGECARP